MSCYAHAVQCGTARSVAQGMDPADAACDGFYDAMVWLAHIATGTRPLQLHTTHTSDCNIDMD